MEYILVQNIEHVDFQPIQNVLNELNVKKYSSDIQEFVKTKSVCNEILPDYISYALLTAHYMLVLRLDSEIVGFALASNMEKSNIPNKFKNAGYGDCLYVMVVCTIPGKGYGKILIDMLDYVRENLSIYRLCLCSIPSATGFYEKMLFLKNDTATDELCENEVFMHRNRFANI